MRLAGLACAPEFAGNRVEGVVGRLHGFGGAAAAEDGQGAAACGAHGRVGVYGGYDGARRLGLRAWRRRGFAFDAGGRARGGWAFVADDGGASLPRGADAGVGGAVQCERVFASAGHVPLLRPRGRLGGGGRFDSAFAGVAGEQGYDGAAGVAGVL